MGAPVTVEELEIVIRAKVGEALANMQQVINRMEKLINQQIPQLQPKLDQAMQKADRVIDRDAGNIIRSIDRLDRAQTNLNHQLQQTARLYDETFDRAREYLTAIDDANKISLSVGNMANSYTDLNQRLERTADLFDKAYFHASSFMNANLDALKIVDSIERLTRVQIQLNQQLEITAKLYDKAFDYRRGQRNADKETRQVINALKRIADQQEKLNKRIDQTADRYDKALKHAQSFLSGVVKGMSEEMAKVSDKTKDADNRTESFGKRVKKVTEESGKKYNWLTGQIRGMLVGMVFYRGLDLLTTSLKDGVTEMAKFSEKFNQTMSSYKSSFEYAKNAVAGIIVPMLERAEPLVTKIVDGFANISNYVGMFAAAANGQTTYNKAIKTTADFLEDTADAAEEAKRSIAGFDELNIIGQEDEEEAPKFEEAEVPKWMTSFVETLSKIPSMDIFNKITSAARIAVDVVGKLVDLVKELFPAEKLAPVAEKLFGIFSNFADKLRAINFTPLKESLASIDFSGIGKAFSTIDFSGLIRSFADLWESIRPFGEKVGEGLLWFYEAVIAPLAKWALEDAIPKAISLIADAIEFWRERIEALKPIVTWLWGDLLVPLGKWTAEALIKALETVRDLFEKIGDWVSSRKSDFAELADKVGTLTQKYWDLLEPLRDSAWEMFKETVSWLIEQLPPLIDQFIRTADSVLTCLSAITSLLEKLGIFDSFIEHIQNGMKSTSDFIQGIVEFIVEQFQFMLESVGGGAQLLEGIITRDLKKSLDAMIDNSRTAVNGLISVVNLFITAINGLLDSMLYGINGAIIGLNNALNVVGIDHSFKTIDLNIPKIPLLSEKSASSNQNHGGIGNEELRNIWQYLTPAASGAVAYTPTPLLTGEYPGARTNPEITAPQNMMYDTVVAANGELVSALYGMIREVISTIEENTGGDIYIDGRKVTETVIGGIKAEKRRTGKSPI